MRVLEDLPALTIATCDYERLILTAAVAKKGGQPHAEFLFSELQRATLCRAGALPDDVVSTNCRVIYRINDEPRTRAHLLVHPDDLLWPGAEISVITPLGIALLGLRTGDRMPFPSEAGADTQEVVVEGVGLRFLDDSLP
jgi:regulator of nucleoside diphosphate kinase